MENKSKKENKKEAETKYEKIIDMSTLLNQKVQVGCIGGRTGSQVFT